LSRIKSKYPLGEKKHGVLLIQPFLPANKRHKKVFPIGLASIAANLHKHYPSVNIGILDAHVFDLAYNEIIEEVSSGNWDIVGISYWTVQSDIAANISRGIRSHFPETVIVHGGIHATICPEKALETADFAVMHEGEETFLELTEKIIEGKNTETIQGIAWKKDNKVFINPERPLIEDLDSLPFPDLDLLHIEHYNTPLHIVGGSRVPIIGSRGCPYKCSYCSSPVMWKGKARFRSPESIVAEMKDIIKKYQIPQFHFWDDNFTLIPKRIEKFCNLVIEYELNIKWVCLDRAELINKNKDLLPLMQKAGCVGIEIGLESANPDTFVHIGKKQKLNEGTNAANNLKLNNIVPLYTCMVFNPGESIMGYYFQKEYLDKVQEGLEWYDFFHPFPFPLYVGQFATAYPGTKFFEEIGSVSEDLVEKTEDRFHHQINSVPYSLLSDVPIRNFKYLESWHYILFMYAMEVGFYMDYDRRNSFDEMASRHVDSWRFLYPFLRRCDGKLTVLEIVHELSDFLKISRITSMRITCFAVYIFAQLGLLRSALFYLNHDVNLKRVDIPKERFEQTYLWLEKFGISPDNIVENTTF